MTSQSELAPRGGPGHRAARRSIGPPNATVAADARLRGADVRRSRKALPEYDADVPDHRRAAVNQGFGGVLLKPWDERSANAHQLQQDLQEKWNHDRRRASRRVPVPAAAGRAGPAAAVRDHHHRAVREPERGGASRCSTRRKASGKFWFVDSDLKIDKPQATVEVDRDMVADAGADPAGRRQLRSAPRSAAATSITSRSPGRSYKVIPQVLQDDRLNPDQVLDYYIARRRRLADPGQHGGARIKNERRAASRSTTSSSSTRRRSRRVPACRRARRCSSCATRSQEVAPSRLQRRLLRPVAPVRAGVGRLRRHAAVRARSSCSSRWPRSSRASAIRS